MPSVFIAFCQHEYGSSFWESDGGALEAPGDINFLVGVTVPLLFLQTSMYILDCRGVPYIRCHLLALAFSFKMAGCLIQCLPRN